MRPFGRLLLAVSAIAFSAAAPRTMTGDAAPPGPEITVFKDPACGCCKDWIEYLRKHGYRVTVHDTSDLSSVKRTAGVADAIAACHTAFVNGYVIEGHVPVEDINRLLTQKPKVAGLAVPGMPAGSPGMDSATPQHYVVLSFQRSGTTQVFARY